MPRVRSRQLAWAAAASFGAALLAAGAVGQAQSAATRPAFAWPDGKRAAISLSFDDARPSQLTEGVPVFAAYRTRVTFYLTAGNVKEHADGWRAAAAARHELANHTTTHPCTGNFAWARGHALEDYTIQRMRAELLDASRTIEQATGAKPATFAYPCGQTFVGRGAGVVSYVPLVHELFLAGRGWLGETSNDPAFVDLAQLQGVPMDDVDFSALQPVIDEAVANGRWLVLAGHDIGEKPGRQVTRVSMLRTLLAEISGSDRGIWVDTVAAVAAHVKSARK